MHSEYMHMHMHMHMHMYMCMYSECTPTHLLTYFWCACT